MINRIPFQKYYKGPLKYLFALVFLFSINSIFGQEIIVKKYVAENSTVCSQFDVTLEITGNPNLRPQEVVLVIDVSGSMDDAPGSENDPIDYAQDAAIEFVKNFFLPENNSTGLNKVSLVTFSSYSNLVVPLINSSGQETLLNAINALTAGGRTNTEAGILEADNELTKNGTFDCATSRSIILLSDGVSTARVGDSNCDNTTIVTPCQTEAIQAGNNAQTTEVLGEIYYQNIFTIGLVGAINNTEQTMALNTLEEIQNAGAFWTENNTDLTDIYNHILGQLVAAAKQLSGQALVSDTIQTGFSLVSESLSSSKGNTTYSNQLISWFVDTVLKETITLNYTIQVEDASVCGTQITGNSVMNYENSSCTVSQAIFENPSICIPCPEIEPSLAIAYENSINYSNTLNNGECESEADVYHWKFYLNGDLIGSSNTPNGTFSYTGDSAFEGVFTADLSYTGTYSNGCSLPEITEQISLNIPETNALSLIITSQLNPNCIGKSTGEIITEAQGGNPPYSYSIDDGNNYQASGIFSNLPQGNYIIKVLDYSGLSTSINTVLDKGDDIAPTGIAPTGSIDINACSANALSVVPAFNAATAAVGYTDDISSVSAILTNTDLSGDSCNWSVTYTFSVSDDCGNELIGQTITHSGFIQSSLTFVEPLPSDKTVECDVVPMSDTLTASNGCDSVDVIFNEVRTDGKCAFNYTLIRTWTATDFCGNSTSHIQTITVQDNKAPVPITTIQKEITVSCANIPDASIVSFKDECSQNVTVIFNETNSFDGSYNNYEITRKWTASDECGNTTMFTQNITVTMENDINQISDSRCTNDGIIELNSFISGDTLSGTWTILSGNSVIIEDGQFDPSNLEPDDYVFNFTIVDISCIYITEVILNINEDCIVLPCGNDVVISKAITPNGDQWNEYFEITGIDSCGFEIEVKIFNRSGALIYKSNNYQNDWNGLTQKSSIANSDNILSGTTYFYIVNLKNSGLNPFTGPIYLGTK